MKLSIDKNDIDHVVCGCSMCGIGIYDGIIVYVLKDGTRVNRFRGEDSRREQRIDQFIEQELTVN